MSTLSRFTTRATLRTASRVFSRWNSQCPQNYFSFFPKSFPAGGPPLDTFSINPRSLRREFRQLQSEHHPDIVMAQESSVSDSGPNKDSSQINNSSLTRNSSLINKAYTSIRNPYTRAAHVIQLHHPDHIDITKDDVSKMLILKYQNESEQRSLEYKTLLMTVLDAHESLEMATKESELEGLSEENDERMNESEQRLHEILSEKQINWDDFIIEAIRIKYWVNIANGIKEWEPGKPVMLTH